MDERFVLHRYKSISHAAMVGGLLPGGWFLYEYYAHQRLRWDIGAILLAMAVTKIGGLLYYRLRGQTRAKGGLSCELHVCSAGPFC